MPGPCPGVPSRTTVCFIFPFESVLYLSLAPSDDVERVWEQTIGKRIVDQETGDGEETRIVRVFAAVALQCAEIIGVTEFTPQLFEEAPITLCPFAPDLVFQMALEVRRNAIIRACPQSAYF